MPTGLSDFSGQTFKKRALEIADKAQNSSHVQQGGGGNRFMESLDESERQRACRDFRDWTSRY
jgi:GINS complex subunit 3